MMPISWAASEDPGFLAIWFNGTVTQTEIIEGQGRTAELLSGCSEFASLMIFEADVDLSQIDVASLSKIYRTRRDQLASAGVRRRAGAALVSTSVDAQLIIPLWNALNATETLDLSFPMFMQMQNALDHIGIDAEVARQVLMGPRQN